MCDLSSILNFLNELFQDGLEYSSINGYRSAISANHIPIDGMSVGKHPQVTRLMTGVSNERPPNPGIHYTYDIETVLNYMRSLPDNNQLPRDLLSWKTATLLGICNINRCMELAALNTKFMSRRPDHYQFGFGITTKHARRGKPAGPVFFHAFPEDPKVCPVKIFDDYIQNTNDIRVSQDTPSLLLGIVKPHKPIVSSSVSRWIVNFLAKAGIDTRHFQGHSVRGASSSKAHVKGVPLNVVLKQGNWSSDKVWQMHYHKNIGSDKSHKGASESSSRTYQKSILSKDSEAQL